MIAYIHRVRVRYVDTDQMGYMHHSNYVSYFEEARWELLRHKLGITYLSLEDEGLMLPVINVDIKYVKAATYDEPLSIAVLLKELRGARLTFGYRVMNANGELVARGEVALAFVDSKSRKPCLPCERFVERVEALCC